MPLNRRFALRALLGVAVSVAAGWILLRSVDAGAAIDVLRQASPAVIGLMVVSTFVDVGARGARWRSLLAPIRPLAYRRVLGYTYLGYLANNVLPARLGELVRSHALGRAEGISRPTVLGTVVVERIVDTIIVVALGALSVVALGVGGVLATGVMLGAVFVGGLVGGLILATISHRLPGADTVAGVAARYPRVGDLGRRLREGLGVARHPAALAGALALSAVAWTASIATFFLAGRAIGVELTPLQAALLSSGVALATIVPSGPGYLGTFELTAVGIATQFGVHPDSAFALALLAHAMILAVTSAGGVVAALRLGVGLGTGEADAASVSPGGDAVDPAGPGDRAAAG